MAQLKIKQISDFVSGVNAIHNGVVGTDTATAIGTAKTEAIDAAESKDVLRASTAVVNIATAKSEAIDAAESKDVLRASTAVVNIATAKSEAISAAVSADTVLSTAVSSAIATVDGRVTTLLAGSTAALDTFQEIESFITSLETSDVAGLSTALSTAVSNDAVHTTGISNNAGGITDNATAITNLESGPVTDNANAISSLANGAVSDNAGAISVNATKISTNATDIGNIEVTINAYGDIVGSDVADFATAAQGALADSALQDASAFDAAGSAATAEGNAIAHADDVAADALAAANTEAARLDAIVLSSANGYADTAEADAIASANSYADGIVGTEETARIAADDALTARIDGLAGVAFEEVIADFGDVRTVSTPTEFDLTNVKVFVNGLQIHEEYEGVAEGWKSLDGLTFTFKLPYNLEATDHVVISGKTV